MKVTYIYHSGFLVETQTCYYLFDYYKGALPKLQPDKPILVFVSHRHPDHFNKKVFTLLARLGMEQIYAVLAKDISARDYPDHVTVQRVTFHEQYLLPQDTIVDTLLSTDQGVAFLLQCPEGVIYHGGDLNDWVWEEESEQYNRQMSGSYRHEIDLIKDKKLTVDIAFLPLDPRQGKDYSKGILYFLEKIPVKKVFPMHYWEKPEIIKTFMQEHPEYAPLIEG